jgi:hypothetical protein
MTDLDNLYRAVVNGDRKASIAVTREALAEGAEPLDLVSNYMVPAMFASRPLTSYTSPRASYGTAPTSSNDLFLVPTGRCARRSSAMAWT